MIDQRAVVGPLRARGGRAVGGGRGSPSRHACAGGAHERASDAGGRGGGALTPGGSGDGSAASHRPARPGPAGRPSAVRRDVGTRDGGRRTPPAWLEDLRARRSRGGQRLAGPRGRPPSRSQHGGGRRTRCPREPRPPRPPAPREGSARIGRAQTCLIGPWLPSSWVARSRPPFSCHRLGTPLRGPRNARGDGCGAAAARARLTRAEGAYGRTSGLYLIRCGWSASAPSRLRRFSSYSS